MIKKITITITIALLFTFLINVTSFAYVESSTNEIKTLFHSWQIDHINGVYVARSNKIKNTAIDVEIQLNTTFATAPLITTQNAFLDQNGLETSRITIYEDESTIHAHDSYNLVYEAPEVTEWLFLKDNSDNWSVSIPENYYYDITLVLNSEMSSSTRSYILSALNNNYIFADEQAIDISISATSERVIIDPTIESELALLPETSGSVFENVTSMANVSMSSSGNTASFVIMYDKTYDMNYTFTNNTDMTIFNQENKVHYYTHDGMKYILISHGSESMFDKEDPEKFIPYTIWNLTTNELETYDRFKAYIYTELESANNVYGYFYVDEFIIDHILSVSLAFRYKYLGLLEDDKYEDPVNLVLEADQSVDGLDPSSWQFDFLTSASIVTSIGMMIPVARWPIALIGGLSMAYVGSTIETTPIQFGDVQEIQEISLTDTQIKQKLNEAYTLKDPSFSGIDSSLKAFKLHLGQFNKAFTTGIEIDQSYSVVNEQKGVNVIEFTYRTFGEVYTVKGEEIDVEFIAGSGTISPEDEDPSIIIDGGLIKKLLRDPIFYIVLVMLLVLFTIGANTNKKTYHRGSYHGRSNEYNKRI